MIRGSAGGAKSKQRAPVVAPDSLHSVAYARVLDLLSEGEIHGFADQDKPLTCVFLNETPLANADGSLNFKNVQVDSRVGTQDQEYIKGFQSVESETAVGVQLRADQPFTVALNNATLSAVRIRISTPGMSKTNTENGDVTGTSVSYAIDVATDGGPFVQVFAGALTGKTSSKYERSHRIDLPAASSGWVVRVRRLTSDSTSQYLQDATWIESYTEIVDAKLRYPNSALVAIQIDAAQFNAVPSRAYHLKGLVIQVPSNYDPDTRAYSGIWDGTFQPRYSNNPAWVFYDLVTKTRYGLGRFVPAALVNKWALYQIAQYCDQLVPDGNGGWEPRFTCNAYIQTRADAYKLLQDLASVFRGMAFWTAGAVHAVADMPSDPVYTYTAANVVDGRFNYSGSARRARHTVALVTWNDLNDFGRQRVEYVDDPGGIARYGIQETNVIAFGCTSRGQARRAGRWILATERYETDTVTFSVGLDGVMAAPGQVVRIADDNRAGKRIGGRVAAATTTIVTLDKTPEGLAAGDLLTVILPTGVAQTRSIASVAGRDVTVGAAFDAAPVRDAVWVVESASLYAQRFRVLSVAQEEGGSTFTIAAVQHEPDKYGYVDFEDPIEPLPTRGELLPAPVAAIAVSQFVRLGPEGGFTVLAADWAPAARAVAYDVQWRKDTGAWSPIVRTAESQFELEDAYVGEYVFRVWSVNPQGFVSVHTTSAPITALPPVLPTKVLDIVGGAVVIDCRYTNFYLKLTTTVTSVSFINVSQNDTIIIEIEQGGENNTIHFGPSVVSVSGQPYVTTPTVGAVDVVGLTTVNGGAIWRLVAQQPSLGDPGGGGGGSGAFVVTLSPQPASGSATGSAGDTVHPSVVVTATPANGTEPYTFSWERVDTSGGAAFSVSGGSTAVATFSRAATTTGSLTQRWRVTVADDDGRQAVNVVDVTLSATLAAESINNSYHGIATNAPGYGGTAGGIIELRIKRNGGWELARRSINYGAPTSEIIDAGDSGNWHDYPSATSGDSYEVKFEVIASSGAGTVTNDASDWTPITSTRTFKFEHQSSSPGTTTHSRTVRATIRRTGDHGQNVVGDVAMNIYRSSV